MLNQKKFTTDTVINPTVSIILPTYNRAHTLKKAIDSVLNQTYEDFELIIVDDGSTDNTYNLIKSINDHRIIYVKHEKNKGAAAARNTGIRLAKGRYIAFQDSDDEWYLQKLEKQIKIIESNKQTDIVYSSFFLIKNGQKLLYPRKKNFKLEGNLRKTFSRHNVVALPTVLIKKECIQKAGLFDERFPRFQDWEFFFRLSKYCNFKFIDEPLVIAHVQNDGITSNSKFLIEGLYLFIEKYKDELTKSSISALYRRLAVEKFKNGLKKEALFDIVKSIRFNPLDIKSYIAASSFLLGEKTVRKLF